MIVTRIKEELDAEDHRWPVRLARRRRRGPAELALPYFSDEMGTAVSAQLAAADTLLPGIPLRLVSAVTFTTGVLHLVYAPDESAPTGTYADAKAHLPQPESS